MELSKFGQKFTGRAGVVQLMDDLGEALSAGEKVMMLGGGNPSQIPQVQAYFRQRMETILAQETQFERLLSVYGPPQGDKDFIEALAAMFRRAYGWPLGPENIVLTQGSQIAFFFLFNMFAGPYADGSHKKILLPLAPEYIGYTDAGMVENLFTASRPEFEYFDDHTFKYHVDFNAIEITEDIGAICVSRPTNPTGNVLTNEEVEKLSALAQQQDIPFIIDNAYGTPFPNIIFTEALPVWNEQIILCMSLSKLGLPGVRTGIIIANEKIARGLADINAISSLAPGGFGARLALDLVRSGDIITLSQEVIKPYYEQKAQQAVAQFQRALEGTDYAIHKPEGAFFLWLWLKGLPITSQQLYERLKARGVIVVPGEYFFPGLEEPWSHKYECLRVSYAQDAAVVNEAIKIIGQEVKRCYRESVDPNFR